MKWKNPGHEFDDVYEQISNKREFYIFGAGDYGSQFLPIIEKEIKIEAYVDNNTQKQGHAYKGYMCICPQDIDLRGGKRGIIITVSQIQRGAIIENLHKAGYRSHIDYFVIEEFLSVYFVYEYNKVYFSSISLLPSTLCNLKCKACLNFNPFATNFYVRELQQIKKDIDLFFQCVDRIMLFHVSGGEPFLYKHIAEVIEYLDSNYGHRIDTLRTVTNGTIIPDNDVLKKLSQCNVEVTVDDYRENVKKYKNNFAKVLDKLSVYKIKHYVNYTNKWINLAPEQTDYSGASEEQMIAHFNTCCHSWQELRDGCLFSCNYDAYATVAGINSEPDKEIFDLRKFTPDKKKELVEFRLGYNAKGYTNFCRKCRGIGKHNPFIVPCAEQLS